MAMAVGSPDGDDGEEQLVGWIHFTVTTKAGDFRSGVSGGSPKTIRLPKRSGWLAADGHLYTDATSGDPMRLVANDPEFNLDHLTYKVEFDLTTLIGEPVDVPHTFFPAPSTDTTVYITKFIKDPDQAVMEVRSKCYVEDIIDLDSSTFVSDTDFRLDDTRTPTDGSVDLDKLTEALAAPLTYMSGSGTVLRLGRNSDDSEQATQVEVWVDDGDGASSRVLFWNSSGEYVNANLRVGDNADATNRTVRINTAAGNVRSLALQTAGVDRWLFMADGAAESGSDAGSDLSIRSRKDDGTAKASVVSIERQTGIITLGGPLVPFTAGTVTAAGTTTLTSSSAPVQRFTGSTTQTVKLPTTGVVAGMEYTIINQSSGTVTVQSSGANTISTVAAGSITKFIALVATPTAAADWKRWEAV